MNKHAIRLFRYVCFLVTLFLTSSVWAQQEVITEVSMLMKRLRDENESVRRAAASGLWEIGTKFPGLAVPILQKGLRDKDDFVRRIAAWILGHVDQNAASTVIPALKKALDDSNGFVRSVAAESLGYVGKGSPSEAVSALKGALNDPDSLVRSSAAQGLGRLGPAAGDAVNDLRKGAQDSDWLVRFEVAKALGSIGSGSAAPAAVAVLKNGITDKNMLVRLAAIESLGQLGGLARDAVSDLRQAVEDSGALVQRAALAALGRIAQKGIEDAQRALETILRNSRGDLRFHAAEAFLHTNIPVENMVPFFLRALGDPFANTRRVATQALGKMNPPTAQVIDTLKNSLNDKVPFVREGAAIALGNFRDAAKKAVPELLQALMDPQPIVRRAVAIALGNIRDTEFTTFTALRDVLDDTNESVRQAAVWALVTLGKTPPDAIPTLQKLLRDPESEIRRGAVVALGRMGPGAKDTVRDILPLLNDSNDQVRADTVGALGSIGSAATQAVPDLLQIVADKHETANLRQSAATTLGRIGAAATAALPTLRNAMNDPDNQVSSAAARAYGLIGSPSEIVPGLVRDLELANAPGRRAVLQALQVIGSNAKDAMPTLIKLLKDEDESVKQMAAHVLGSMGLFAKDAIQALIEMLDAPNSRGSAAEALSRIALAAQDAGATDFIVPLEQASEKLSKKNVDIEFSGPIRRAIDDLKRRQLIDFWQAWLKWTQDHPTLTGVISLYILLLIAWPLILLIKPLWLLHLGLVLEPFEFSLPLPGGGVKLPLRHVLLLELFRNRSRVLDAWVIRYADVARQEFESRDTVKDRSVHIPLPVVVDGSTKDNLSVEQFRPVFTRGQARLLICEQGGTGKTSLACQIARWGMADGATVRLCKHLMIPVLMEDEIENSAADPLVEAIRGQLRVTVQEENPIPKDLVVNLLRRRRILVIVDHLSEMTERTRRLIRPGHADFPVNALVVTSRVEEELDGVSKTIVRPLLVRGNRLSSFLDTYLASRGKRSLFDDDEFFTACKRLTAIVGQRNITILLAKVYADQIIASKDGQIESDFPNNIPDLMLYYLNNINRGRGDTDPADQTVQSAAKIIAWECLKEMYRPTAPARTLILNALSAEGHAGQLVNYLERRLRLINTIGVEKDRVRFALDPLAEYLAGLHLVNIYGENDQSWRAFLEKADQLLHAGEPVREFLSAVRDCCEVKCVESTTRSRIVAELEKRLAFQMIGEE